MTLGISQERMLSAARKASPGRIVVRVGRSGYNVADRLIEVGKLIEATQPGDAARSVRLWVMKP